MSDFIPFQQFFCGVFPLLFTFASLGESAESDHRTRLKHRVVITTDIGGDPDDQQSMVRLLLYANDLEIEGLLATANRKGTNAPEIHKRIDAYEAVYENLLAHDPDYPAPDELRRIVKEGSPTRFMPSVGEGKSTPASRHIIDVVDRSDPRPVWISVWGAATDLAQALWEIRENRSEEEVERFVRKLRVYDIAGQDDTGAWICHTFQEIFYLRSVMQFQAISKRVHRPFPPEVTGPNLAVFDDEWIATNVQSHGPLGELYVPRKYKYEGDTPAFLYLLPNGLSDPERMHQGNWGGRFNAWRTVNAGAFSQRYAEPQLQHRPYRMHTEAPDTWHYEGTTYRNSTMAPIFRWREMFQNDFAARMDWSVTPRYGDANHPPIAAFNDDDSSDVVDLPVRSGQHVALSAERSRDPDGDTLAYRWWVYQEPSSWKGAVPIENADTANAELTAPRVFSDRTIHVVLEVSDDGTPPLTSYKRVILNVTYK
jgi:hypothetical protein